MVALTARVKFYLSAQATDMRKSFAGLCGVVTSALGRDPPRVRGLPRQEIVIEPTEDITGMKKSAPTSAKNWNTRLRSAVQRALARVLADGLRPYGG